MGVPPAKLHEKLRWAQGIPRCARWFFDSVPGFAPLDTFPVSRPAAPFLSCRIVKLAIESMRNVLSYAAMAAMIALAWSADGADVPQQKAPVKKTAAKKKPARKKAAPGAATPARKGAATASSRKPGTTTRSASSRGRKTTG